MAIEDRNLSTGTKLWAKYKGSIQTAEVIEGEGGLRYRLSDGREFKSPSAAGTAITEKACNGWAFWTVGDPGDQAGPVRTTPAPRATVNAVPKPERRGRRGRKTDGTASETAEEEAVEEPSEPTGETQPESIECGQCGEVLPNAEAAAAHFDEVHSA